MRIDIITVFPEMVEAALDYSILKRARERGLVTLRVVNLRDFTSDRHRTTDDVPYGGGGGMVMKVEPVARALQELAGAAAETGMGTPSIADSVAPVATETYETDSLPDASSRTGSRSDTEPRAVTPRILLTDPRGVPFTQALARKWAREAHLILICGHYEGVDERIRQFLVTDEVSIGDYILTGGELPALVIVDALTRLQPGALGDEQAPDKDTFAEDLLEYPHYTRPRDFNGWAAPDILLCGHHAVIERWRRWRQLHTTRERRPDLFARLKLSEEDQRLLAMEEPTAPPDNRLLLRSARALTSLPETHAAETEAQTEKREETDGTGTGNHT